MITTKSIKVGFSILSGLIGYAVIGKLGLYLLQLGWADYALKSIDKSYTLEMLLSRQFVGILASLTAGIITTKIENDKSKTAWFVGIIIFCGGSYIHFITKTWFEYPIWYHFTYVLLIIPAILFGRFLVKICACKSTRQQTHI